VNGVGGYSRVRSRPAGLSAVAARLVTVPVVASALLLGSSACSGGAAGTNGQSGSCASVIRIAGTTYIGGRGVEGTGAPVPHSGALLHGTTPPCNDTPGQGSTAPAQPETAYAIAGVPVIDAVVRPGSNEVMVAERLWQQPWEALPTQLQPYVRR
jgi:hypothetical protein